MIRFTFLLIGLLSIIQAKEGVDAVERDSFFFTSETVSATTNPSTLKYYDFTENLDDEIVIDVFKNKNLANLKGKKIFVGYGVVDPTGDDCKIFTPDITGLENNITVCLPWWRIERSYERNNTQGGGEGFSSFLATMQRPRPPKNVAVCDSWIPSQANPGGAVTCTSYYDKTVNEECMKNPMQPQCYKDNCSSWVKENCARGGKSIAYGKESRDSITLEDNVATRNETRFGVETHQYTCPGGSYTNYAGCDDLKTVAMHPYECKPDDPSTPLDDSIMKYCDESLPIRDSVSGDITGFEGECPAEASPNGTAFSMTCKVDSFSQTREVCTRYADNSIILNSETVNEKYDLKYTEHRVRVYSGEVDRFAAREDCLRANKTEEARPEESYMVAEGSGSLDDDIYVIVHKYDDTHDIVYCNQQHNNLAGKILNRPELGGAVECLSNAGSYSFSQKVPIHRADIVSVQQATEDEDKGRTPFSVRAHYRSTKVVLDGITAAPETYHSGFPYMPHSVVTGYSFLPNWENTLASVSIMFPYAGNYTLYFFSESGELLTQKSLYGTDFKEIGAKTFRQLNLAENLSVAPGLDENNKETLCLNDDWVEYGGGVYGGKKSRTGEECQNPTTDTNYLKTKAIKRIVVKDMITGSFTVIPLVYPLGYPNRVFVSKLNLYEDRLYHCYDKEPALKAPF